MTAHLPECECYGRNHGECPLCVCDRLRASEQRVLTDLVPNLHLADMQGYNRGLRAAEAAVNEVLDRIPNSMNGEYITVSKHFPADLIDAIRALKEKP